MSQLSSRLAYIDVQDRNPLTLFKEWHNEVISAKCFFFQTNVMCLATSTKNGKISNRNVVVKQYDENGFVFVTDGRSRKSEEIEENPWVAATFLWNYKKDETEYLKQVRMEGKIQKISQDRCLKLFNQEKLYCKIRSHLCHQDQQVDWEVLKSKHDKLLDDVLNNKRKLTMPDHYVGYEIIPERYDFYSAGGNYIADRVVFTKEQSGWNFVHVAA
ncbi:hypothetical protein ILUMI_27036 [Ignelater luminosus]|uniref:pyridoxal 5'-phosphate synthase n=1 Tax=Ignelater luminosus TaxID=2038154 RepID=A0A8K0C3V5_IGNLU|nr:hypothetical protein ILUMI_27036 [Ignelater luminosus]